MGLLSSFNVKQQRFKRFIGKFRLVSFKINILSSGGSMSVIVIILFVLNALMLIGVVLIQQPKTSAGLFSGTGQSLLGTSGKTFWTKFTAVLAGSFMILCLLMSFVNRYEKAPSSVTDLIEKQQQQAAPPPQTAASAAVSAANPQSLVNPAPQVQGAPKTAPSSQGDSKK